MDDCRSSIYDSYASWNFIYEEAEGEREEKKVFKMPWGLDINMANAQYVPRYMVTLS